MDEQFYQSAIDILTSQGKFYINLGLERIQKVLDLMGNPQKKLKFIHVAGTNGKGSVCAMLSAILQEGVNLTGQKDKLNHVKIGLFTSPHVFEYTERIKINDVEILKDIFAEKILKIVEISEKNEIHLTEFEILTGIAFEYFAENNVDIVILETGLGGRLDATNVIEQNICSVITNIDLDHTERLGNTIEKIAAEKAGIVKKNCPVVISTANKGFSVVKKAAQSKNSSIFLAKEVPIFLQKKSPLQGAYQVENLALCLSVIEILNNLDYEISDGKIENGLKKVKHPCRFEYIPEFNLVIDGAHNPNGAAALRKSLNEKFPNQKIRFVFGCLRNKDYEKMMKNLFYSQDEIYFYHFANPNSATVEELAAVCSYSSNNFKTFNFDKNTPTVVCGSFYMLKELLQNIGIK